MDKDKIFAIIVEYDDFIKLSEEKRQKMPINIGVINTKGKGGR